MDNKCSIVVCPVEQCRAAFCWGCGRRDEDGNHKSCEPNYNISNFTHSNRDLAKVILRNIFWEVGYKMEADTWLPEGVQVIDLETYAPVSLPILKEETSSSNIVKAVPYHSSRKVSMAKKRTKQNSRSNERRHKSRRKQETNETKRQERK